MNYCTTVARLQRRHHHASDNFFKLIFNVQWKGFTLYMNFNPRYMNRFILNWNKYKTRAKLKWDISNK